MERKRIQSRVRAGLEKAKADGKTLGRPKKTINKAKVWSLRDSGMRIREVANEASISAMTVQRILKNGETSAGFARDSAEKSAKQIEANSPSSSKKARPKRAATPVQAESQTSENRQR